MPNNLCELVRYFIGTTIAYIATLGVIAGIAYIVGQPIAYILGFVGWGELTIGLIADGMIIAFTIRALVDNHQLEHPIFSKRLSKFIPESESPSFFSLIWKWAKSHHDKICLTIKIT